MSSGPLASGTLFAGDFRVVRSLAQGGMGSVYVAEQLSTGKQRALKLMRPELALDPRLRERFEQEARIGARIQSDHVVEIIGAGVDAATGAPWIAMELLEGEDLARRVETRGPLPLDEAREILGQVGHALGAAHHAGIVHRDLKPENIFVARTRQQNARLAVKVLDFGIAKVVAEARATSSDTAALGTPRWMAPEQTESKRVIAPSADVWALGLIAFQLLTGRYYWTQAAGGEGVSVASLMREVLFEPIVPASQRAAQYGVPQLVPPGFDAWFARCVDRDPAARHPDGGQAMGAFEAMFGGTTASSPVAAAAAPSIGPPPGSAQPTSNPYAPTQLPSIAETNRSGYAATAPPLPPNVAPRAPRRAAWILVGALGVMALGGTAVGLLVSAAGPDLSGHYAITSSQNPGGGGSYAGSAQLARTGRSYRVAWTMTKGPGYEGIALFVDHTLGVAYSTSEAYGVTVYTLEGSKLHGRWATAETSGVEDLEGPPGMAGSYTIKHATGGHSGSVTITPAGETFRVSYSGASGNAVGVGIRTGDKLVVGWAPPGKPCGVVSYEVHGNRLVGRWATLLDMRLGNEVLTKR